MRRLKTLLLAASLSGFAMWAMAGGARIEGEPVTTDGGNTLEVSATVIGLAEGAVSVRVRATGVATVGCSDRDRQTPVTESGEQDFNPSEIKNGRVPFSVSTRPPTISSPRSAGCSSDTSTPDVKDVAFQSVSIRVLQAGRVVLQRSLSVTRR